MHNKKITSIVSNDAGAAEIISSYVKNNNNKYVFVLSGPARKIFKRKIKKKIKNLDLNSAEKISNKLICGTSGKSKIEVKAIEKFKKNNKKTIAIVEHWTNYKTRFLYNKNLVLPDKIWVFDRYAKEKIEKIIKTKIVLKKNYYFSEIKNQNNKIKVNKIKKNFINILYVSEPISEIKNKRIVNYKLSKEYKTLKYFFDNIEYITKKKYNIIFRPHPLEKNNKYKWIKTFIKDIRISKNKLLIQDIMKSDIVIGRQTMALVVALKSKKKVISCIPPDEKRCIIPYKGVAELRDLVKKNN